MKLEIFNNSTFDNIQIVFNDKEYKLSNEQKLLAINTDSKTHIKLMILDKNSFKFSLPAILTNSFTHKDSWCFIKCNLELDIETENEICEIELNNICSEYKKRYIFESFSVNAKDAQITNIIYSQTDTADIVKKHKLFNLLLTSFLPIILISFVISIVGQDILCFFTGLFGFFVFTVPSLADIKKFNKICKNSDIAQTVLKSAK
ncbi:MAG: hypothetical protein LUH82_02360 [Clostridiales bacterium]|nr:hypothetical protein [Clostridiales bacterium]